MNSSAVAKVMVTILEEDEENEDLEDMASSVVASAVMSVATACQDY